MAFMMKEDEAFDPVEVGFFGADRVVFGTKRVTNLIKEFRGGWSVIEILRLSKNGMEGDIQNVSSIITGIYEKGKLGYNRG